MSSTDRDGLPSPSEEAFDRSAEAKPVQTDAQAYKCLPQPHLVRKAYDEFRSEGKSPQEAFDQTLLLWRELQQDSRPRK